MGKRSDGGQGAGTLVAALLLACGLCALRAIAPLNALAQVSAAARALPPADVDELSSASSAHLENARRFLAEQQWGEAVEALRRVQESEPARLIRVALTPTDSRIVQGFERYITAAEYSQWRLAALASEAPRALEHYRQLVDGLAESWFRTGAATNDEQVLRRVIEQTFASRFGDDALLRLGDLAIARGEAALARSYWQRISPLLAGQFAGGNAANSRAAATNGMYPDTDLDLGMVQARLVLASIMEGSSGRAEAELATLREQFAKSSGRLGAGTGTYADLLRTLLNESAAWPAPRHSPHWTTFAGDAARGKIASGDFDTSARPLWSYSLPRLTADKELWGDGRLWPADDRRGLLAYHPIVVDGQVLVRYDVQSDSRLVALDLKTGNELWHADASRGIVRPDAGESPPDSAAGEESDAHRDLGRHLGVARYTLSACGNRVFARGGSPVTVPSTRRAARWLTKEQGFLLGFNLTSQGRPLEGFPIRPPTGDWSIEGTPLCDRGELYVAMRRADGARSQIDLAAFHLPTTPTGPIDSDDDHARATGKLKWQTRICSSATPGSGDVDQLTHLLVTLDSGRLYLNTSAGVVAAVNALDGRLLWLVKYPRTGLRTDHPDQPEQHLFRDLTPCLAWKDLVIVAPADGERIFALRAASGELAWTLPPGAADDAVHLLGVAGDTLLASGNYLYWIDAARGQLHTQFPRGKLGGAEQSAPSPRGFGRGIIVGQEVWWPTRERILVFAAAAAPTDFGWQPQLLRDISLVDRGLTGGNLILAGGVLLIAGSDRLVAFGRP